MTDNAEMTNNTEMTSTEILEQWKTCVEMANSVSQRRDTMNNIFVTLNLAVITAVSLVWDMKSLLILLAGIVVCILWMRIIKNYKLLNTAKFDVIAHIENKLPYQPFVKEWNELKQNKKYVDGTKLERALPVTFIVIYGVAAIVLSIIKLIGGVR